MAYAVEAMQSAMSGPVKPPAHIHLRDEDWPFWNAIISARAASTWNDADLAHAANLARCQADIDRIVAEISVEGDIVVNAKGTPVVNPKHSLMETLSRRAVALSRVVHVHAEATKGRSRDAGDKLKGEQGARDSAPEDSLIPGLRMVKP